MWKHTLCNRQNEILSSPLELLCVDDRFPFCDITHNLRVNCGSYVYDGASWDVPVHSNNCQYRLQIKFVLVGFYFQLAIAVFGLSSWHQRNFYKLFRNYVFLNIWSRLCSSFLTYVVMCQKSKISYAPPDPLIWFTRFLKWPKIWKSMQVLGPIFTTMII